MRRWRRWAVALVVLVPLVTVAAQGFRGRRRAPGNEPNPNVPYDGRFTFVRMRFEPLGGGWDLKWDHDYPRAETHFMKILQELTTVKPFLEGSNIIAFDDPALFKYPVAYVSEPGYWSMNDQEIAGLQAYVHKGGFLIFDDFAGNPQFYNFQQRWERAFPGMTLVQLDKSHPIFDSFYHIESLDMDHPNFAVKAQFWGAFEDNDPAKRLVMIANFNNDIGDYMEWSDEGFLPVALTNEAYKLAVNYVVYAMTH